MAIYRQFWEYLTALGDGKFGVGEIKRLEKFAPFEPPSCGRELIRPFSNMLTGWENAHPVVKNGQNAPFGLAVKIQI